MSACSQRSYRLELGSVWRKALIGVGVQFVGGLSLEVYTRLLDANGHKSIHEKSANPPLAYRFQ